MEINDLLDDKNKALFQSPLEAAVLCSALNKSYVWSYENEWRVILLLGFIEGQEQRIQILVDNPISITFGFHFLKAFFYYDFYNEKEKDRARQGIENISILLDYMKENKIRSFIIVPSIGEYKFERKDINIEVFISFIKSKFKEDDPKDIHYYYVYHDEFMSLINE